MKVLIADDSKLILERLQEMLSVFSQVEIIGPYMNGIDALDAIRIEKPDLAIVDIKMPGLTGLKVLSEIRKEDKILKFIILTLFSTDNYRNMAISLGADYFFSKVDDFEQITVVVKELSKGNTNTLNDKLKSN